MRRVLMMAFAICLVMAFGASSAMAAKGGGKGSGKPCPPNSPVGQINEAIPGTENDLPGAPSCGNVDPGGGGGGNACPPNSPNPGGTPPNCGHPPVEPPAGKCASADLVLLTRDAMILCLYLEDGERASDEAGGECEGALLATGEIGDTGLGACVFLPPASSSRSSSLLSALGL